MKRIIAILLIIAYVLIVCGMVEQKQQYEQKLSEMQVRIESLREDNTQLLGMRTEKVVEYVYLVKDEGYEVIFTNYYTGDSTGSTQKTGSGLSTKDFQVNELGWFTYDGKVVLATATWEGIHSNYGMLEKIKDVPYGYHLYHYFDELTIEVDGIEYDAIVLDTCGASMMDLGEDAQRIDIFISSKNHAFGMKKGIVKENE